MTHNLSAGRVLPISHCPPQLPGQVAPCSPSWQEQMLGAIQMPLPQPNEQRAERRNAVREWGLGPPQTSPGNEHSAGEDVWDTRTGTYEGCSARCPWRVPSQGSSHSRTPRGRRGGPAGVCKRGESTFHVLIGLQSSASLPASQEVSQHTVFETL